MGKKGKKAEAEKAERKRMAIEEAIRKNDLAASRTDSMISRITLRDVATFDHKGVTIGELQRVNFIYGGNGCGKTTISRLLTAGTRGKYKNCEVEWTGPAAWSFLSATD